MMVYSACLWHELYIAVGFKAIESMWNASVESGRSNKLHGVVL